MTCTCMVNLPLCSYAVVLWELLTGERPYYGLNLFVVAYGVGHGTLSLPIPDGCPDDLGDLMRGKWFVWSKEQCVMYRTSRFIPCTRLCVHVQIS